MSRVQRTHEETTNARTGENLPIYGYGRSLSLDTVPDSCEPRVFWEPGVFCLSVGTASHMRRSKAKCEMQEFFWSLHATVPRQPVVVRLEDLPFHWKAKPVKTGIMGKFINHEEDIMKLPSKFTPPPS